ncbi:hypothetical protein [Paenibacillus koleovorans]|uniref:mannitol dehydrogenase family protein n=1 Tax=Paenibacillus koleovorans TaxID=121608 RepID=UPI000FDA77A2|nr:hypothetical protein [Paenibacillus koleovorans]
MKAIVFGAGKIARGFVGHLLQLSGYSTVFVDVHLPLVELLNARRSYEVHIMGNPGRSGKVTSVSAILLSDVEAIAREWAKADIGFVAVGGKNLAALGAILGRAFQARYEQGTVRGPVNLVVCENWKQPAIELRQAIRAQLAGAAIEAFDCWVGIAESAVMRSGVDPTPEMLKEDPLCCRMSDYWELPVDEEALVGSPPPIQGVQYMDGFAGFLERKFYTYNAANGTVSYLGFLRGHEQLFAAATDPGIVNILDGVYSETSAALAQKYGIPLEEQLVFSQSSRKKLQDPNIDDSIERNARDPVRKLGPDDRLVGSARLVLQQGGTPRHLAISIAAALYYEHPEDPIAFQLKEMRLDPARGTDYILQHICRLAPEDPLTGLVRDGVAQLREKGWIV